MAILNDKDIMLVGLKGNTGNGIKEVKKAHSFDLTDYYKIYFDNGTDFIFSVKNGEKGDQGVSIVSVKQTTVAEEDGSKNIITITLSDGTTSEVEIKNGSGGSGSNYLLNPDFSINQKGKKSYNIVDKNSVDGWKQNVAGGFSAKTTVASDGIELKVACTLNDKQVVTVDGESHIGLIHFDTSMSPNEVAKRLANANLPFVDVGDGTLGYFVAMVGTVALGVTKFDFDGDRYGIGIQDMASGAQTVVFGWDSEQGYFWGDVSEYALNGVSLTNMQGLPIGTDNDKLSDIIYIKSFDSYSTEEGKAFFVQDIEESPKLKGQTLTLSANVSDLQGGELMLGYQKGDARIAVPNDGTQVSNIYFNTEMSIEEVVATLSTITSWIPLNETMVGYFIAGDPTNQVGLAAFQMGGIYGIADFSVFTAGTGNIYFASQAVADFGISRAGWQSTSICAFNNTTANTFNGMPTGAENDKLTSLAYIEGSLNGDYIPLVEGKNSITFDVEDSTNIICGIYSSKNTTDLSIGGVAIPNDGTLVEKIIFNTNASDSDIFYAALGAGVKQDNGQEFYIFAASDNSCRLKITLDTLHFKVAINDDVNNITYYSSDNGWLQGFNGKINVNKNSTNIVVVNGTSFKVGVGSDELTSFVRANPKEVVYTGEPVPNDGTIIDKIYFNTKLSAAEIKQILDNANLESVETGLESVMPGVKVGALAMSTDEPSWDTEKRQNQLLWQRGADGQYVIQYEYNKEETVVLCATSDKMVDATGKVLETYDFDTWNFALNNHAVNWNEGSIKWGSDTPSVNGIVDESNSKLTELMFVPPFKRSTDSPDASVKIHSMKLEAGLVATDHLSVSIADELAKCQRVCQNISLEGCVGYAANATTLNVTVPLTATMKNKPALDEVVLPTLTNGTAVTAMKVESISNNSIHLALTTSGLTTGNMYMLKGGSACLNA